MSVFAKMSTERRLEICGVFVLAITILLFLALVTDGDHGDTHRQLERMSEVPNVLGKPGAVAAGILTVAFGRSAHILYCITGIWACMLLRHVPLDRLISRLLGLGLLGMAVAALLDINAAAYGPEASAESLNAGSPLGGLFGGFARDWLLPSLGAVGANVVAVAFTLVGILLTTEFLFLQFSTGVYRITIAVVRSVGVVLCALGRGIMRAIRWSSHDEGHEAEEMAEPPDFASAPDAPALTESVHSWLDALISTAGSAFGESTEEERQAADSPFRAIRINLGQAEASPGTTDLPVLDGRREMPFDDIGESPSGTVPLFEAEEAEFAASQEASGEGEEEILETGDLVAASSRGEQLELEVPVSVAGASPSNTPDPRLVRRNALLEDLPADYVYPKRYTKPSIDLFDPPVEMAHEDIGERLVKTSALLEDTLKTFGVEARVSEVTRGPTITRYELEPAPGTKVSRFISLADDLALALKAHRVRVEAPIPGKGRVGIEVPNSHREAVVIRSLLESGRFVQSKGCLDLALGKDVAGEVVVCDLSTMPHLLVAGATGAGKTVCVKTMIASLLHAHTPEELQLMFIDPKMVELSIFDGIPHLMTPVITDAKKAATGLRWLITEMEERYRLFTHLRVRNIEVYNQSVENGEIEMAGDEEDASETVDAIRKLPYIVCVIDELADLMMLARAEVEDAIARLAQLARAVGIHLIIATQRPSVDVLTGVIKANFPARISFQVSSKVDSRCILDQIGAERLIGRGDMLYLPAGQSKPTRIQGAFVSDEEMNALIAYLKMQAPPQYRDEIEKFGQEGGATETMEEQQDELFDEAVRVVLETGQASISMVQRRLRVGYTRAARLIDMMEISGIVGPHVGSKAREILVESSPDGEAA